MSGKPPGKPSLKLTFGKPKVPQAPKQSSPPSASSPSVTTPGTPVPKLKLKFGGPKATAPPVPEATKAAKPKKSTKAGSSKDGPRSSKKRTHDVVEKGPVASASSSRASSDSKTYQVQRQTPPIHPPQEQRRAAAETKRYTEIDPALEEEFVLRMPPGEDCDYVRQAVEEKRFGPRSQGGADISFKALTRDARRATVTVRGRMYAASMVDLPCIVEGMKSWDKRAFYKSADICQMLLVLGPIKSEDEARTYPLPKDVEESTHQYAHGLTPPMRWVRKRRFRKRISNRTIEAVELEVARLLKDDAAAIKPPEFEVMDYNQYMREESAYKEEYDDEQDAEGEVDETAYMQPGTQEDMADLFEDDLAAEMEAALAAHAEANSVPTSAITDEHVVGGVPEAEQETEAEISTPKVATAGETSGDEDESDESSPEDANADLDEDALEQQRQLQQQREEIAELEALVRAETLKWEQMTNPILKGKVGKRVQRLKQELELKKVSIGEGNTDD
ncbi:transcription factor TFIID complex subunit Taf7 [Coccidioides immitis RMSCC 3703]|uniref:Transcription factor TFIID complex subunit Taf7 n=1 Tax=Coccidioides immitis RMSCC 3703 TaxID=454286 RepID=A0A0J8U373_COCIT|nr:transcription factor TFIID complex subunit Taf7 [Coccidioides immitis RMSCC 3703]